MSRKWVINASPLIALGKVSRIGLFEKMCLNPVVPEGVARELDGGSADDPARAWIRGEGTAFVRRVEEIPSLILSWDLGKGETEVISWAYLNPGYEAILDDRAARNCAAALGIRVRGTVGIILLANREGMLHEVKPLLSQLIKSGFRISPDLLRAAYKLADEE